MYKVTLTKSDLTPTAQNTSPTNNKNVHQNPNMVPWSYGTHQPLDGRLITLDLFHQGGGHGPY